MDELLVVVDLLLELVLDDREILQVLLLLRESFPEVIEGLATRSHLLELQEFLSDDLDVLEEHLLVFVFLSLKLLLLSLYFSVNHLDSLAIALACECSVVGLN